MCFEAAEQSDEAARRIIADAAAALCELVSAAANALGMNRFPLAFYGGLLEKGTALREGLIRLLDETGLQCALQTGVADAAAGAAAMALARYKNKIENS
jgi:N-acetylglucosamine kinase-like BadF-type ATPase